MNDNNHAIVHPAMMSDFDSLTLEGPRQRRGKKWTYFGPEIIPAWIADMDFAPPPAVEATIARARATSDYGYPGDRARSDAVEAYCAHAATRHGWHVNPDSVELLTDVMQGAYIALDRFSAPGDAVAILTPIYPPFLTCVKDLGRKPVCITLQPGTERLEIDLEALDAAAAAGARILLLSSPHNPSGRVFQRSELEAMADIALRHDMLIVADEIHGDIVYDGRRHIPMASLAPEVAARTLTLSSASKSFNIAGLRLAVAVFGSDTMRKRFLEVPRGIRGGPTSVGLAAATAAWTEGGQWLDALVTYLQGNRDTLANHITTHMPAVRCLPAEGTYLAWLDCRALGLEATPWRHFLDRAGVALSDGLDFGDGGAGHVRLNFATSRPILRQLLERMTASL